jgi:predicted nucleotidyltransferase
MIDAALREALEELLGQWVDELQRALPRQLIGVYLQGSLALGAADVDSDVDFVVAVERALRRSEVARLQALHASIHDRPNPWARRLEGSYFPAALLRTYGRPGERLWYLDHGARKLVRSTHCNTAVVRQTLREHGIRLSGPEPGMLIDEVPPDVIRDEIQVSGYSSIAQPWAFHQLLVASDLSR